MAAGNSLFQSRDFTAAREVFNRVVESDPTEARAWYMLGGIAAAQGETASAIEFAQRSIALLPTSAEFHFSLAGLLAGAGRMDQALPSYQEAARLRPQQINYSLSAAGALLALGRLEDAFSAYRAAVRQAPLDARTHFELGKALQMHNRLRDAEAALQEATRLAPQSGEMHMHLAIVARDQGRPVEAEAPARKAVDLAPDMYQGWFILGSVLARQGRHTEAVEWFRKVVAANPDDEEAWSCVLFSMNYSDQFTAREVFDEHVRFGRRYANAAPINIDGSRRLPNRRLRVGYLSGDFRKHPVAVFFAPILGHHDRTAFEVFCYHNGKQNDEVTARLQSRAEHWRPVLSMTDDELARLLRDDQLDILVELSGHTDGQRLNVLSRRVAPIQVSYLGYPGTTGLTAIDYRITDAQADPVGEADALHVEQLLRLPETFLCYEPPDTELELSPPAAQRNGYVTFGSLNNFAKISPTAVSLWSRVLDQVPGSKLLIKSHGLQDPGLCALLLDRFKAEGIGGERLILKPPVPDDLEHLRTYREVDIALDTFPYHGTTTTMEALWMGVPVVTMRGDRHLSRVGASILSCIGLSDLVAATPDDYANKAAALAADPSRLELLRRSLRERITGSAVADAARFTANLERAYHDVWNHALLAPAMAPAEVITHDGAVSAAPPTPARGSVDVLVSSASEALQAGDLDAARAVLEQALALDATHPRALSMLRGIAARKGEVETALALARRAIASQPTDGEHHHWLGGFLASHRRLAEAIPMYEEAIRLNPRSEAWRLDLYAALVGAGRMVEAAAAYAASEHAESPNARAYFDLGDALMRGERPIPAESAFVESARLAPDSAGTHLFVALARRSQGRPVDAEAPARFATEVAPDMPQGWFVLGTVLAMQGRHTEAVGHYRRALELAPDYPDAWDCLLFSMHYSEDFSARELFDAHVNWAAHFPEAGAMAPWASSRDPGHRLRVGYLSADYVQHPVAQFLEPLLKAHDRTRIELFCYHVGKSEDELTKRLKSYAEHWRRLKDVSDDDLEKELRGDQIDILVDLSGHTAGHRLPVLARRVAPVQVTYLGYPNTTGLKAIDYRITDARADPPGEADTLNVEKLVRLPETFLCYEPLEVGAATRSPPSQRLGYITFGSFNNFAKISAMSIALWAQILAAVPKAKMLVKARWLQEPGMRDLVSSRFRAAGVDESRLVLGLPNPDHQEHMRAYDAVDIALDTFPYHGTTTTLDALWMNVPVVTLAGDRHASRVGASILTAVGLPQLIARSPQEYVALAVKLARSPQELEDYGRSLRARLTASPLMDASAIARELEHAYFRMWDSKLRG